MKGNYLFPILEWYDRHYASEDNINNAFMKGLINRSVDPTTYGSYYTFTTKEGVEICRFYKDSSFGFSSQAYGIQVPAPFILFPAYKAEINEFCKEMNLQPIK